MKAKREVIEAVAVAMTEWVMDGGWLNIKWPVYIVGADALDEAGHALAAARAEQLYPGIWGDSQCNYAAGASQIALVQSFLAIERAKSSSRVS